MSDSPAKQPSLQAMKAAVEMEIMNALGHTTTRRIGEIIDQYFSAAPSHPSGEYLRGLEDAAQWHDAEADRIRGMAPLERRHYDAIDDHVNAAAAIRALKGGEHG